MGSPGFGSNVTPDGRFLVFQSDAALTADDTSASRATQIYRYDAISGDLVRISIGNDGFDDDGNRSTPTPCAPSGICSEDARIVPVNGESSRTDPSMSDDGDFVFFQSPVGLTPGALDDRQISTDEEGHPIYAQNVYEWEADGTEIDGRAACNQTAGCVSLLSDGTDAAKNQAAPASCGFSAVCLFGADRDGRNVFFATEARLTGQDTFSGNDFYDARVDGGFAEPAAPIPCQGDACKGQATQPGSQQSPATPGFAGKEEGPKAPEKCKKRFVRKGSKCVKKQAKTKKSSKHHRKHEGGRRHIKSNGRAGK